MIDIGSLGWVVDELLAIVHCLLEESLADSLVYNDQGNLWRGILGLARLISCLTRVCKHAVLVLADFVQLLKLKVDNLLAHGVTNTIAIDEDMVGHLTTVKFSVALERPLEIVRQNCRRNDLLTFLRLWTSLSVVFAHVRIVSSTETYCALFALVTNVDTNKHGLV